MPGHYLQNAFNLPHPIIQAPMAGGPTTPELVAAVTNAGGLGTLAASFLNPEQMVAAATAIRALTSGPFAINLFILPEPIVDAHVAEQGLADLQATYQALGCPLQLPKKWAERFLPQFEALLEIKPAAASFTFGILTKAQMLALKAADIAIIGTATTVAEARAWAEIGADAVCVQGFEAGGHRGTFINDIDDSLVGLMALVPACVDAVTIPVIAAGGIMDGRGIVAAQALGAAAVQLGTAFLSCPEAALPQPYLTALNAASGDQTRLTRLFSGKHARGIVNGFMQDHRHAEAAVPAYPIQNALTGPLRAAAKAKGDPNYLSLWAGQGVGLSRRLGAAQLVAQLVREAQMVRDKLLG
ncbi:MAG: nitronate monooxygenase [Neisseriaceae bacterium]|nr:nitronate monooxygenase [Neisseriaceae bacterium]